MTPKKLTAEELVDTTNRASSYRTGASDELAGHIDALEAELAAAKRWNAEALEAEQWRTIHAKDAAKAWKAYAKAARRARLASRLAIESAVEELRIDVASAEDCYSKRLAEAEELLKSVEWGGKCTINGSHCPSCLADEFGPYAGHTEECGLDAWLRGAK